jgi:outer membrane immunogenic protein
MISTFKERTMRTTFAAVSALALLAAVPSEAFAADVYSSAKDPVSLTANGPATWNGFFLGVNGGWGQNLTSRDTDAYMDIAVTGGTYHGVGAVKGPDDSGFLFGGQIGYLAQYGNLVFGVSLDFDGANVTGDQASISNGSLTITPTGGTSMTGHGTSDVSMHQQFDYVGDGAGIIGFASGPLLFYGKGGFAFSRIEESVTGQSAFVSPCPTGMCPIVMSRNNTETGWMAGVGVGYKLNANWDIKFEWNYFDFGKNSASFTDVTSHPGTPIVYHTGGINTDLSVIKAAVDYQVTSLYQPLK